VIELPDEVARWAARLGVAVSGTPVDGVGGWVAFGERRSSRVVVKMARRSPHSSAAVVRAFELWGGHGAVRLLDFDEEAGAFLLEAASPGTRLSDAMVGAALDAAMIEALVGLWIPLGDVVDSFPSVSERLSAAEEAVRARLLTSASAVWWNDAERCLELVARGVLSNEVRLLHGDPKPENFVLSARGWLAIDPIPMVGDPVFEVARYLSIPVPGPGLGGRVRGCAAALEIEPARLARVLYVVLCHALAWHVADHDQEMIELRLSGLGSIRALLDP
jgi:streptomycin 6-kinase